MRIRTPSPAMVVALIALVLSLTGAADAARNAVFHAIDGHRITTKPVAGGILVLGRNHKFPRSAIPASAGKARSCPSASVDIGTWCLESAPYPVKPSEKSKYEFVKANKACEAAGGYLPSAGQLVGAAARVRLESVITDSPLTATIDQDPSRGLKDEREMSSTLVTTEAGSAAAGFEGVSEGATGDPRQGQGNPVPLPADPRPESLQYVDVYSDFQKGGFAGSQPVSEPQNFRCAYELTVGAQQKVDE